MTPTQSRGGYGARLLTAYVLVGGLLLSACSGAEGDRRAARSEPSAGATSAPLRAAGIESNEQAVERALDGLGTALRISLPDVVSYDVEGSTLTVLFAKGSKDEATTQCLISRSAAQGLGMPADYQLVMAYPDGEKECAEA